MKEHIKSAIIKLGSVYRKGMNTLCGRHPYLRPWHFQWHAVAPLNRDLQEQLPRLQGRVLDAGCGFQPYRSLLGPDVRYVGMDIAAAPGVDLILKPGEPFPAPANDYDAVLCTQVLEHVDDMDFFLSEVGRTLKPGGKFILSVPFIYHLHGIPHDYRRLSEYGVRQALSEYDMDSVSRHGGIGSSLAILFLCWLHNQLDRTTATWLLKVALTPLLIPVSLLVNVLGLILDKLDTTESAYGNLLVVAIKCPGVPECA